MDYQISPAYHELIETRSVLETLHHDITGEWPRNVDTPRDIADRIRATLNRQRQQSAEDFTRELFE
jgi:hypothetical protein